MSADGPEAEVVSLHEVLTRVPTDADRARRATDLTDRARLVEAGGWADVVHVWSSGEVAGVALLLGHTDVLHDALGSEAEALDIWAATLWGVAGGEDDRAHGHPKTRAWFTAVRSALRH